MDNNSKSYQVLVAGAGQLGSRYVQGLSKCALPLSIHVVDVSPESLLVAEQRWNEVAIVGFGHEISFHDSFDEIPGRIEVAIVATTAGVRPSVVEKIADRSVVRYWVLEKVLAQSEAGLEKIIAHVSGCAGAWVNTPRRMMPWHKQIKLELGLKQPMVLRFNGGAWGLACNAVHLLDLLAWWSGEALEEVGTEALQSHWVGSKRPGFFEIFGMLEATFTCGTKAFLTAELDAQNEYLELTDGDLTWLINEGEGVASRSDGKVVTGDIRYQSQMSAELVESILERGSCDLPTLDESVELHRFFLRRMLEHWRLCADSDAVDVPIT